jgi:hypothetical protein
MGIGVDDKGIVVRFEAGATVSALHPQTWAQPASSPMNIRRSFPCDKAAWT